MTREEEIRYRYERELKELHREQANCKHDWAEAKFDPEIEKHPQYETRWQGVDCFPVVVGYKEVSVGRWSRTCKKCGKVEYTKEQVPAEPIKYKPKF